MAAKRSPMRRLMATRPKSQHIWTICVVSKRNGTCCAILVHPLCELDSLRVRPDSLSLALRMRCWAPSRSRPGPTLRFCGDSAPSRQSGIGTARHSSYCTADTVPVRCLRTPVRESGFHCHKENEEVHHED